MNFTNMNIRDFINNIINYNHVDNILDICKTQSEKGFVFERLFDIVIKFGFCDVFPNSEFDHLIGNSNNAKLRILENLNHYLDEKVFSGNSGGCSDITLQNKNSKTYIFISSKYPKTTDDLKKHKSVDYYDVQNIVAMATKNKHIYINYKIYIVVPNKNDVLEKVKKAKKSSEYITEHFNIDTVLDKGDLNKYFLLFKQDIIKHANEEWQTVYLNNKENLILRFHQELITHKTSRLIEEGNKSFLWGCKCRSGKTYMIGGIIIKQFNVKKKLNVLIITPAPTETAPQFTNDLLNKYKDFDKFKIHHIEDSKCIDSIDISDNNIFVMSKQLLQKYTNDKTITKIKSLKLDIIGFDENHFSGTTDLSKEILASYASRNTVKIYLTATFNKPLNEWNILPECQMYWDIEDEQICKSILVDNTNIDRLKQKHGDQYISETIKFYTDLGNTIDDIFKCYNKMPDLHLITNIFDQQRYEIIKEKLNSDNKMGFCFDTLFGLNKSKTQFSFENEVKTILRYISGSNKEEDGEKTIFTRINNICSESETRLPFTQIWFLPSNNINEISQCLKKIMEEDLILKRYDVLCINRKNKELAKDIKDEINKKEIEAKSKGRLGLIILAGNMLTLGITLNLCDLVILMNNALSSDKVLQQMYRCMTEGNNKKIGFVVDLNISRVLNTCINYTIYKNEKSIDDKMRYLINNHLINIDVDMMLNKKINSDVLVKKLMDIWREDPVNNFRTLLKKLDTEYTEFDNATQRLINKTFTKSVKGDKIGLDVIVKDSDDETQDLPTGIEKIKIESDNDNLMGGSPDTDDEIKSEEEKEETRISFTKDVLPYVIPLTCILTIKNSNMDFVKMLNDIKDNPELLETFDDQCLIWWNKRDLIDLIKNIVSNYFDKSSNTFNISVQFKMSLQSLIDNPKELLELINDCLKPKEVEKKTFGEVFTPINFINDEMLQHIEDYWTTKNSENIWSNEKLTWYDPATGMGNYPIAIYYKLMNGLKTKIPDPINRKKHIIEKQLFMGELNKKNCLIVKQIFNINNEYKLNLYEGDTLCIDLNKVFGFKKFDIIIGNPPYNEELTSVGAKPLYNKFIEYYVDKCNLLSYVVPSRWFAGGKGLDKFRKMMINRTDIVFIKHYDNACKIFGNLVDIKGGVNYFLIDKDHCGLCDYNGSKVKFNTFDVILDSKYYCLVNKFLENDKITKYYISQDYYRIQTNDARLKNENFGDNIKCYVSQQKGFVKYIDKNEIKKNTMTYKVITARAAFCANSGFGNMFMGYPGEVHTKSYISFNLNSENEAKSLLSYMTCKLPNLLLSLRKSSQDISESTCKWIPLPPLNKEWNDREVYKYFKLSEDEIKLIKETKIVGYNDIKQNNDIVHNIIKNGRKQYYLVDDKLYKIKKDKSLGDFVGLYINGEITEQLSDNCNIKTKSKKDETSKCQGITINKKPCSKNAIDGTNFCRYHQEK